jgi:gamma-glutamylcyclotransferase (GGCT)/AIG2-like uncharacterized protein YtfP
LSTESASFAAVADLNPEASGELVFVYGTLRLGGSNAFRMDGAEFMGKARIAGAIYVISWYPGLVVDPEAGQVLGEVYRVGPEQLRALDEFEGVSAGEMEGSEYRRVPVEAVLLESLHGSVKAWVWEWKGPVDLSRRIPSGDWLDAGLRH